MEAEAHGTAQLARIVETNAVGIISPSTAILSSEQLTDAIFAE